jgi:hypothetical protein
MATKKAVGRPPRREGERLSKNRTFRVRGDLDEKLQAAVEGTGRSVSEEIERRLEESFLRTNLLALVRELFENASRDQRAHLDNAFRDLPEKVAERLRSEQGDKEVERRLEEPFLKSSQAALLRKHLGATAKEAAEKAVEELLARLSEK